MDTNLSAVVTHPLTFYMVQIQKIFEMSSFGGLKVRSHVFYLQKEDMFLVVHIIRVFRWNDRSTVQMKWPSLGTRKGCHHLLQSFFDLEVSCPSSLQVIFRVLFSIQFLIEFSMLFVIASSWLAHNFLGIHNVKYVRI